MKTIEYVLRSNSNFFLSTRVFIDKYQGISYMIGSTRVLP
jgi:hypothetical protein